MYRAFSAIESPGGFKRPIPLMTTRVNVDGLDGKVEDSIEELYRSG
jgi:hypothetical protein